MISATGAAAEEGQLEESGANERWWGWATPSPAPPIADDVRRAIRERLGFGADWVEDPVPPERATIAPSRVAIPRALAELLSDDPQDRALHTYGQSYRDLVRSLRGSFETAPDLVARPRTESDVERLLAWCSEERLAAIPFGGGTSVVGGVEPRVEGDYRGVVTIDLSRLARVRAVDRESLAACIEAGATGPKLEQQLRAHGLTLRFYPQSFERSTLGGWLATRAAGHFATFQQHIDELVESITAVTPAGLWQSRRLPGSGAGPSPDRWLLGSEGTLGVITHAWLRVRPRPRYRARASVAFGDLHAAASAVRSLLRAELQPANLRALDADEAYVTGALDERRALLVIGLESAVEQQEGELEQILDVCRASGGEIVDRGAPSGSAEGVWRSAFTAAPYLRDLLVRAGVLCETFETAITWERFGEFVERVRQTTRRAVEEVCGAGLVSCRITHFYPDGCAPYFTVLAPARQGDELRQWDEIKVAASEAILAAGGTITHHHAVGRDHREWYRRQRPVPFATALAAAKASIDPAGIMNPGALL